MRFALPTMPRMGRRKGEGDQVDSQLRTRCLRSDVANRGDAVNRRTFLIATGIATITGLTPAKAQTNWIVDTIYAAGAAHGVSGAWLVSTAQCESGLNPGSVGRNGEIGIFQFMPGTWATWGSGNIWSVADQANTAAAMFAAGLCTHWCCSGCYPNPCGY